MKLIVCDTGPILHLQEANLLELLQKTGKIYIPKMVDIEMNELCPQWKKHRQEKRKIRNPNIENRNSKQKIFGFRASFISYYNTLRH